MSFTRKNLDISFELKSGSYPRYRQAAVDVTTTYNPSIQFGGQIQIQSDLTPACGTWAVTYVEHELESEIPHGKWFSTIQCGSVGIQQ